MKNKHKRSKTNGSAPPLSSAALILRLDELSKKLHFEDVQVLDAAIEQPQLYLLACRLRVDVMEYAATKTAALDVARSELFNNVKTAMNLKSAGRVTNVEVESALSQDPRVQKLSQRKLVGDKLEELAKGLVESFRQRLAALRIVADVITSEGRVERSIMPQEKMSKLRDKVAKKYQ
jgi:hypothetical protein